MDLGDRSSWYCVLDERGEALLEQRLGPTPKAMQEQFGGMPRIRKRGELPPRARKAYSSRILQTAKFFNEGIETILYEPLVRNRIGLATAGTVYTSPAWSMNVVYARLGPSGLVSTFFLSAMLGFFRVSAAMLRWYCALLKPSVVKQEPGLSQ